MLSVVRVSQSITTTPAMTAGMVNPTARESRNDWKLAVSNRRMTPTAIKSPRRRPPNISVTDLPPHGDVHPIGRLAGITDRLLHAGCRASEILARDVCAQRQHALHVVAVIFAERCAVGNAGHVAEVDLSARPPSDGQVLHLLQGIHLVLGDLDLHLITNAALGIGPIIRGGVATG